MRTLVWILILSLLGLGAAFAQPKIASVVNNASYSTPPTDSKGNPIGNTVIAEGSIFAIFGSGLGPTTLTYPPGLPLPTAVPAANGTSVSVSSGGTKVSAYIVYTVAGQVGAILPSNTPVGTAQVTVTYNGKTSAAYNVSVVQSSLGVFTSNQQTTGPAAAQHGADSTPLLLTKPAHPGETIVLYATGLGPLPNGAADNVAPGSVQVGTNVTVNIAGQVIKATYAGRSPSFAGLDQVNVTLPSNVATGCYIAAEITASGQPSNMFFLPIAQGSTCTHPYGLGADSLAQLDQPGGTVNTGQFQMLTAVIDTVPAQGAGGVFLKADANATFQLFNRILVAFGGYTFPIPGGACAVLDTIVPPSGFNVPDLGALGGTELQAGFALDLTGSDGNSATILRATNSAGAESGGYLTTFFSTLGQGTWTLSGSGGTDVGKFSGSTNLPDDLVWSNVGNLSNPPRSSLTITWTGGNLNSNSIVTIFGSSVVVNPTDPSKSRGEQFYCNAPASAGTFMVPGSVVSQLPSGATIDTSQGEVAFGTLGISSGNGSTFTVPLVSGAPFAGAYLAYGEAQTISVTYQ